jgi:hypothetical protein
MRVLKELGCLIFGHKMSYLQFGKTRIPYGCSRCGRMWSELP